jgi:hypothetical protein
MFNSFRIVFFKTLRILNQSSDCILEIHCSQFINDFPFEPQIGDRIRVFKNLDDPDYNIKEDDLLKGPQDSNVIPQASSVIGKVELRCLFHGMAQEMIGPGPKNGIIDMEVYLEKLDTFIVGENFEDLDRQNIKDVLEWLDYHTRGHFFNFIQNEMTYRAAVQRLKKILEEKES